MAAPVLKPREVVAILAALGFVEVRREELTSSSDTLTVAELLCHFTMVATLRRHEIARDIGMTVEAFVQGYA